LDSLSGIKTTLTVKLQNSIKYLEVGKNLKAIQMLEQFISKVLKLPNILISTEQKDHMIYEAQRIINMIEQ